MNKNFLKNIQKSSELLQLTCEYDWKSSPVGPIEKWPESLKSAVSLILENGMPMYMAWGKELTQFYNDGYISILGTSKHPKALWGSAKQTWAEIWDTISPMWEKIFATGHPTSGNDFKLSLERNGKIVDSYFAYSNSAVRDDEGKVAGIFVAAVELTEDVKLKNELVAAHRESELSRKILYNFFMQAPIPMCMLEGPDHRYTLVNAPYEKFSGRKIEIGKTLLENFTYLEVAAFIPILNDVYLTGTPYAGIHPLFLPDENGIIKEYWIRIGYHAYRDLAGRIQG